MMDVYCDECGKKYLIDPDKIDGPAALLKCKACGHINTVRKPEGDDAFFAPSPAPAPEPSFDAIPDAPTAESAPGPDLEAERKHEPAPAAAKKPKIGLSIRAKLTLIIVLLVLVSLSVAGFIASYQSRIALSNQAEVHLSQIAKQKSNEYALTFNRIRHEAQAIANYAARAYGRSDIYTDLSYRTLMPWDGEKYGNPVMNEGLNDERLVLQRVGLVLKSAVAENPYLSLGYLGTETGMTTFDDEKIADVIEDLDAYVVTGRPWYTKAKKERKTIWTAPYVDANTKKPVVTCATPVYRADDTLIGVVGFDVLLDTILQDILTLDIGYKSYAFIVDNQGKILVKPGMKKKNIQWNQAFKTDNLLRTKNREFKGIVAKMTQGKSGVAVYSEQNKEQYVAHEPLRAIDAGMAIVASRDEVIKPAIAIQNYIIMVCAGVLVCSILIGLYFGNSITKPIKLLSRQADLMSQGVTGLDVIPEDRGDEIGLLPKAFNRLVSSLRIDMTR